MKLIFFAGALFCSALALRAADSAVKSTGATAALFDDPVLARGRGVEVRQSLVDEMFAAFRANRASAGQPIPESQRPKIEADILDKLIATQLCVNRATAGDKAKAQQIANEFITEQMKQVPSEESFNRQLRVMGMSPEQFRAQITEQAVVKAVIDRELKDKKIITEAEARKFYEDNPNLFQQPEMIRVSHILISTLDTDTGKELPGELKLQRRELAEKLLARAKAGEDFSKLVKEFSEDKNSKDRNGEYTIMRNDKRYVLPPEFEGAAFSMAPNQISDIVLTPYGYHIIKGLEKIAAKKSEYALVESRIKESLQQDAVQKELPDYIAQLKKDAGVEILKRDGKN
jgi:peptidyl-prolyl cis-trans isomerase C